MSIDRKKKTPAALIAGIIISAVGVGLIWIIACDIYGVAISKSWPSVTGIVQSSKVQRIYRVGKPDRFRANIRYAYEVGGKSYSSSRVNFGERTRIDAYPVVTKYPRGSEVKVYYKPDDPKEAVLETVMSFNIFAILFSPFILLLGLYLLRSGFKELRDVS